MNPELKQNAAPASPPEAAQPSLLDEIISTTKRPGDEESGGDAVIAAGIRELLRSLLDKPVKKVDSAAIDARIAELDRRVGRQTDEILHHPEFQQLESVWRGLKHVVDQVDFRANCRVEVLNATKEELQADFEDAPEISRSGLYKTVYSQEFGQHGGTPFAVICSNYAFGPGNQDMQLLKNCAAVSAMAHAPFLGNAAPEFFGVRSFEELPTVPDLNLEMHKKWQSFRESEDSRYVGLVAPRVLIRLPYDAVENPVKGFNYTEDVVGVHSNYLWTHAANALVARMAKSFAKTGFAVDIVGPQAGGEVEDLPLHTYEVMGGVKQTKIPTEVLITDRREFELAEQGFIGLVARKDTDRATFFSAYSTQKPATFGKSAEGLQAATNARLGSQLPYLMCISRLAHYVKVLQRESLGQSLERADLERNLNAWISQYVADFDDPAPAVRARRPLRQASINVEDVEGSPGFYRCAIHVRPWFKYNGAAFTLSLVGKLDKEKK